MGLAAQRLHRVLDRCARGRAGAHADGGGDGRRLLLRRLRLHRIEIVIRPENAASLRVVDKLGLRYEGSRPAFLHIDGAWRDHEVFVLNADEVPGGCCRWPIAPDPHRARHPGRDTTLSRRRTAADLRASRFRRVTGLIYVAIIAVWAVVLVPTWLRRHDHLDSTRSVDRFSRSLQALAQRDSILGIPLPEVRRCPRESGPGRGRLRGHPGQPQATAGRRRSAGPRPARARARRPRAGRAAGRRRIVLGLLGVRLRGGCRPGRRWRPAADRPARAHGPDRGLPRCRRAVRSARRGVAQPRRARATARVGPAAVRAAAPARRQPRRRGHLGGAPGHRCRPTSRHPLPRGSPGSSTPRPRVPGRRQPCSSGRSSRRCARSAWPRRRPRHRAGQGRAGGAEARSRDDEFLAARRQSTAWRAADTSAPLFRPRAVNE